MFSGTKSSRNPRKREHWPTAFNTALRVGMRRVRGQRALVSLARWFFIPVAAAGLWIGVSRFTLLDLARWPAFAFVAAWLLGLLVWVNRLPVTPLQSAKYLDRALGLDARLATCIESARSQDPNKFSPQAFSIRFNMFSETVDLLAEKLGGLPSIFRVNLSPRNGVALAVALAALLAAIFLPTPLDAVRAERAELQATLAAQLQKIGSLRDDIMSRPNLSADVKQAIASDLSALEQKLLSPDLDRAAMLADLADAQQQLRRLSASSSSDFDPLVSAALSVQAGVANNADWVPADARSQTDLGRAAEASDYVADATKGLTNVQRRSLGQFVDRAATQASAADPSLAADLSAASKALGDKDAQQSQTAFQSAAERFRQADKQQQTADAVDTALSSLDDSRQSIAQAGKPAVKKAQIGFGRRAAPQSTATPNASAQATSAQTPGSSGQTGDSNDPTGQQQSHIGNNMAAFGAPQSGGPQGSRSGAQPGNPSGSNPGSGGQPAVTGAGSGGGSGPSSGGGAGQSGSGGQGVFNGQINGPVGGANGAISQVQNPMGNGISSDAQPSVPLTTTNRDSEQVYIPSTGANTEQPQVAGNASPQSPDAQGLSGRAAQGETDPNGAKQALPGPGALIPIRTPYTQIIGQYAQKATQALERAYIPSDAKQYVKDYFTALSQASGQ